MKIQWSGLGITEGRGAAGSSITSRNLYGNYQKNRSPVTNPNTVPQQNVRSAWAGLMGFWNLLGDDIREEWNQYASSQTHSGRMGQQFSLSGCQEFMKVNFNILISGWVPIVYPPIAHSPLGLGSFSCSIDLTLGVEFTATLIDGSSAVPADTVLVVYGSRVHNMGRMRVTNGFRGLARLNVGEWFDPLPDWSFYTDVYPMPTAADKIFFRCAAISVVSGQRSPFLWCSGIVQP